MPSQFAGIHNDQLVHLRHCFRKIFSHGSLINGKSFYPLYDCLNVVLLWLYKLTTREKHKAVKINFWSGSIVCAGLWQQFWSIYSQQCIFLSSFQGIIGNPVAHACCCKPPDSSVAKWVVNGVSVPTDPWAEPNTDHDRVVGAALEEGEDEASDEVTLTLKTGDMEKQLSWWHLASKPWSLVQVSLLAGIDIYMMHYHDFLSKLFLEETTEIEQWPDTFQSCPQFTASTM